ncbi:50S ribosomal protein L24 [Candidatus Daviesbacteria bacterium]|nr:50S ribosomal protein L24 [Candidatus Daviesbacteria bacterium]
MKKLASHSTKIKIKKGDKVKVLLGKDRGKEGAVAYVLAGKGRVFVEGANLYKRSLRADALKRYGGQDAKGQIIDIPKSLDISNVGLICPSCKKVTRVGYMIGKEGKIRICKKCRKEI